MDRRAISDLVIVAVGALEIGLGLLASSTNDEKIIYIAAWLLILGTAAISVFALGIPTRTVVPSVICSIVATAALSFGIYLANETGIQIRTSIEITPFLGFVIGVFYFGIPAVPIAALLGYLGSKVVRPLGV